jgi:hypothetical protein
MRRVPLTLICRSSRNEGTRVEPECPHNLPLSQYHEAKRRALLSKMKIEMPSFKVIAPLVLGCLAGTLGVSAAESTNDCDAAPTRFVLTDLPYTSYFYSDCHSATQLIVTSPLPNSNLEVIRPRLLVSRPLVSEQHNLLWWMLTARIEGCLAWWQQWHSCLLCTAKRSRWDAVAVFGRVSGDRKCIGSHIFGHRCRNRPPDRWRVRTFEVQ